MTFFVLDAKLGHEIGLKKALAPPPGLGLVGAWRLRFSFAGLRRLGQAALAVLVLALAALPG